MRGYTSPMSDRTVRCVKLGQELPGLAKAPFPGALGQRIFENVSSRAWDLWQERAAELMKARSLSMADAQHRKALMQEMEAFLFAPAPAAAEAVAEGTVMCVKLGKVGPKM